MIRDAAPADTNALLALERACYPPEQAYDRAMYRYMLANGVNLVEESESALVGFVGAFTHRAWRVGHIVTLNVHPDARRRGLGARLLAACEARLAADGMSRVTLEVNVANAAAIALYEREGYQILRRAADYYAEGYPEKDAFVYSKTLSKAGAPERPDATPGQPRSHG